MSSVRSKNLEILSASQFRKGLSEFSGANTFFTIGRVVPWTDENSPPQANTSTIAKNEVWYNMIGGKKLNTGDARHAIPRHNWTSGTTYVAYDDTLDSLTLMDANSQFYVLTDEYNVYKCISNNYGGISTSKPTSINTNLPQQLKDKYIWKYMYTLSDEEKLRFLTEEFMPVKTLAISDGSNQALVQFRAIKGGIHNILVTNGGSNYINANNISVTIQGDGNSATAFATVNSISNTVDSIIVTNPGFGYSFASVSLDVPSPSYGSGANARAIISPEGGHGSDPIHELGGSYLLINLQLDGNENDKLVVTNDYRQVAIIENPYIYGTTTPANYIAFNQTLVATLTGLSDTNYEQDEWVYQGASLDLSSFKARVVQWDSSNSKIKMSNVTGSLNPLDLLIGQTSTTAKQISSFSNPDLQYRSGSLLYIDNIKPIQRSDDQLEDFRIVLKF